MDSIEKRKGANDGRSSWRTDFCLDTSFDQLTVRIGILTWKKEQEEGEDIDAEMDVYTLMRG